MADALVPRKAKRALDGAGRSDGLCTHASIVKGVGVKGGGVKGGGVKGGGVKARRSAKEVSEL
jgi:hypothetical protein